MSRGPSPFSPRTILAVLAVGAGAFLLLLYAIGAGLDAGNDRNGGAHAAANGLNGYAGLVRLLEAQGHEVSLSRSESHAPWIASSQACARTLPSALRMSR